MSHCMTLTVTDIVYDEVGDLGVAIETTRIPEILNDDSFIEETDRLTLDEYIIGNENEKTRHAEALTKINARYKDEKEKVKNNFIKNSISYEIYQNKINELEKENKEELIVEYVKNDHIIQSILNDIRNELFQYYNQIIDNYSDEVYMPLANVYLKMYMLNIYENEHRVNAYLTMKANFPEEAIQQWNLTYDHLTYIQEVEEKLETEIKNNSKIMEILKPKIQKLKNLHSVLRNQAKEIIEEYKLIYKKTNNYFDAKLIIAIIITASVTAFVIFGILLSIKQIRRAIKTSCCRIKSAKKNNIYKKAVSNYGTKRQKENVKEIKIKHHQDEATNLNTTYV